MNIRGKLSVLLLVFIYHMPYIYGKTVHICTPSTSLVLEAKKGEELKYVYYGTRIGDTDIQGLGPAGSPYACAYAGYGKYPDEVTPLSVIHSDGNMTTRLVVRDVEVDNAGGSVLTRIKTSDDVYPFDVDVCYRTYEDSDVLETWTEITSREKGYVTLTRYDSACIPIHIGNVWVCHMSGGWANEARIVEEPLQPGVLTVRNKEGIRNSQTSRAEMMFSLDGKPQEENGATIGAALCYSGNYALDVDTYTGRYHYFRAGINPDNSSYRLDSGRRFVTPPVAMTFSMDGKGGVSRNFHRWGRNHVLCHGNSPRKVLLNSWEGVYFDINEPGIVSMMNDAASLGVELFVLDDGWFGGKYQRSDDTKALGDWVTDRHKLPNGLKALIDSAHASGIGFGLWIEPEMADISSELYEKHPDWIIKAPGRAIVPGRGGAQVVLDFSNPRVRDYAVGAVDRIIRENPGIEYIKWDSNSGIYMHGSQYLARDRQSHLYIDWHNGFREVLERVREKHPDIVMQACGGGGGRVNWGVLKYFDEFWTSDNTDALQRVYMQWGTSHFYPAIAMGAHISASPNHQTCRSMPIKYRADVAMSGRLGIELQPDKMTEEEYAVCRNAVKDYRDVREVIQFGDLYRLKSPYDRQGIASLMYVSPGKDEAVFFWYRTEVFAGQILPVVRMAGLEADGMYTVTELNRIDDTALPFEGKSYSGSFLMNNGLDIPYRHDVEASRKNELSSRVLHLKKIHAK